MLVYQPQELSSCTEVRNVKRGCNILHSPVHTFALIALKLLTLDQSTISYTKDQECDELQLFEVNLHSVY